MENSIYFFWNLPLFDGEQGKGNFLTKYKRNYELILLLSGLYFSLLALLWMAAIFTIGEKEKYSDALTCKVKAKFCRQVTIVNRVELDFVTILNRILAEQNRVTKGRVKKKS